MRVYLDTGLFIDYLSARGPSGAMRRASRRGRSGTQVAQDAEECFGLLASDHELFTSSLTFYEVEEAMYKSLAAAAQGVTHAERFLIPAARALMDQMAIAVELFGIRILDLSHDTIKAQLGQLDLRHGGIRAADSLHMTSAIAADANVIVSGDKSILDLDGRLRNVTGDLIRCFDTDVLLRDLTAEASARD